MLELLKKYRQWLFPGAFLMILIGLVLIWLGLTQTVTVILDGEAHSVRTPALTVGGVLRAADISTADADRVLPSRGRWFWGGAVIRVDRAREVMVKTPEETIELTSAETIPANLLLQAEIKLFPQDRLLVNGATFAPNNPLDHEGSILLQYQPAMPIRLVIDGGDPQTIYTGESTLGAALEEAGVQVSSEDWISESLSAVIKAPMDVTIRQARTITVTVGEDSFSGLTAADTVGEALMDLGFPLQNLNYSRPAEDEAVPDDWEITVVQVDEDIQIMTDEISFTYEYMEDPNAVLDEISIIEQGQTGIYATRERIRYADGEEIRRDTENTWQASEARDGVLGYGTNIIVRTEVVDGQTIEYWRKINVYATSYTPCDTEGVCHPGTSTGLMMVKKGSIAVTQRWLEGPSYGGLNMWGLPVYVAGYGEGLIADSTYYAPDYPWIDLGYSEDDYVPWHSWTTMYFLTPVPDDYIAPIITP